LHDAAGGRYQPPDAGEVAIGIFAVEFQRTQGKILHKTWKHLPGKYLKRVTNAPEYVLIRDSTVGIKVISIPIQFQ
jgi:hypothetical protein